MRYKILSLVLITIISLVACEKKNSIDGLWLVKLVKVGEQNMTPNGRWMRFNTNLTLESGNGWLQHSYGTWSLKNETSELSILNTNGLHDTYEPFKVTIEKDKMTWRRVEDGEKVEVFLERTTKLPQTFGDQLFGLWELEEIVGNGSYFEHSASLAIVESIFFRWEKRFVIRSKKGG